MCAGIASNAVKNQKNEEKTVVLKIKILQLLFQKHVLLGFFLNVQIQQSLGNTTMEFWQLTS